MLNRYVIMARDINARDGAEGFKSTLFSHALVSCPTAAFRSHVRNNHPGTVSICIYARGLQLPVTHTRQLNESDSLASNSLRARGHGSSAGGQALSYLPRPTGSPPFPEMKSFISG